MAAAAAGGVVRLRPSLRHGMRPYSESGTGRTNGGAETSLRPGRRMPSPSRDGGARSGWTRFHTARYRWPQPRLRGKTYQETGSRKRNRNPDPSAEHNDTNPEPPVSRPGGGFERSVGPQRQTAPTARQGSWSRTSSRYIAVRNPQLPPADVSGSQRSPGKSGFRFSLPPGESIAKGEPHFRERRLPVLRYDRGILRRSRSAFGTAT